MRKSVAGGTAKGAAALAVTLIAHEVTMHGGMERQLTELVSYLISNGVPTTVISRRCELPPHPNLTWVKVPGPTRPFPLAFPWFYLVGSLLGARHRRGVVHTMGAIVETPADVATVQFLHLGFARKLPGFGRASKPGPLHALSARVSLWMACTAERRCFGGRRDPVVAAVSSGVAAEVAADFPHLTERLRVVPNGVDLARFRPDSKRRATTRARLGVPASRPVALFVGSEWGRKGLEHAVESLRWAPDHELWIVGSGDVGRFQAQADAGGVGDRLRFIGKTSEPHLYYSAADAFVFPTAYEAFSLATLEAAASGLPLLLTDVNGTAEIMVNGVNGWIVERSGEAIGLKLAALARDRDLAAGMGSASRQAAAKYTWARINSDYASLYSEMAAGGLPTGVRTAW